jgi:MFS family permease
MPQTSINQATGAPPLLYGWGTVLILVAAYAVSILDRQIAALLVDPVRADLGINDTQIGLVQGPAFGVIYAVLGLPLGWLADRVHRLRLIATGIALWSVMTMACGLATNFHQLLLARAGVGIGEAALVPAAVSLLADLFTAQRRALPMTVFTAGQSVGTGLALYMGAAFVVYAQHGAGGFPLIGMWLAHHHSWQIVFIMAGLTGLPVAAVVLLFKEPLRQAAVVSVKSAPSGLTGYLKSHGRVLAPMLAATTLLFIITNSMINWIPSFFIRGFHWAQSDVGHLGPFIAFFAVSGNVGGGFLTTWMAKRGYANAPLRTMILGSSLVVPVVILAPLSSTPSMAIAGLFILYFSLAICFGIATAAYVTVTPSHMRGRIAALYLLLGNLFGLSLGPPTVGALLDHVFHDKVMVGASLAVVGAVCAGPAFLLLFGVRHRYAQRAIAINPDLGRRGL